MRSIGEVAVASGVPARTIRYDPQRASGDVRGVAQRHLADVQRRIEELQRLQAALVGVMEHCHGDEHPDCPILQDLEDR